MAAQTTHDRSVDLGQHIGNRFAGKNLRGVFARELGEIEQPRSQLLRKPVVGMRQIGCKSD